MIDWSNIFNILFVTAACAFIVFFLVSAIAVAVKGKRKCGAFDVVLRVLSSLAVAVSAVMFACAVLTMVGGGFCIKLVPDVLTDSVKMYSPVLVAGGNVIELPMPDLFVMLSQSVGSNLAAVLLVCAIAALTVDCLVANKKTDKKQTRTARTEASIEQAKCSVEQETINGTGETDVLKSDKAAEDVALRSFARNKNTEQGIAGEVFDRSEPPEQMQNEFVGIKDGAVDDFDTFGDIDTAVGDSEGPDREQTDTMSYDEFADPTSGEPAELYDVTDTEDTDNEDRADNNVWLSAAEDSAERTDDRIGSDNDIVNEDDGAEEGEQEYYDDEQIEPYRDIYIPRIRTIVKSERLAVKEKSTPVQTELPKQPKSKQSGGTGKKPRGKTQNTGRSVTAAQTVPDGKKLPVTRRYVILDRRNAVNMFGEYLKERNQADKDKLKSSLNTIIIE